MLKFLKHDWRVVRAYYRDSDHAEAHKIAYDLACCLLDENRAKDIYFCVYSTPYEAYTEFKLIPSVDDEQIVSRIKLGWSRFTQVTISDFKGSKAHAQAFRLARELHGTGDENIEDVIHWISVMLGHTYFSEVSMHSRMILHLNANLEKSVTPKM